MKGGARLVLALCVLAAVGMLASHLALTDIRHGLDPDLGAEWWVIRVTFLLNAALVVAAGWQAARLLRASGTLR